MLFNSLPFLLFFPAVCLLYFLIPQAQVRMRNWFLLIASYAFYMNWEPTYALLLLTSTGVTYAAALGIAHSEQRSWKRLWLISSLVLNLVILFLFKYYNFLAANIQTVMETCGMSIQMPHFTLLLPVGISFYTFQALGYSIDVYRGTTQPERHFPTYALFVSFFPQLVAGPIERSNHLLPQFRRQHRFNDNGAMAGLRLMLWGYFLKLVVADRCAIYVDSIFNNVDMHTGGSYLVASVLFPFQIYGDFAGYSLIAIGAARMMGFQLMENFRCPYFAKSVGEFWHRWHISLSTWFKDYVYIPLGGNRVGRIRQYVNLMITFMVSGIWHGANWTFLCWGTLHGLLLCIEKALGIGRQAYSGLSRYCHWLVTFVLVCLAWVLFRARNLHDAATIYSGIFSNLQMEVFGMKELIITFINIAILILYDLKLLRLRSHFSLALLIAYITIFGILDSTQFIYFQF